MYFTNKFKEELNNFLIFYLGGFLGYDEFSFSIEKGHLTFYFSKRKI